MVKIGKGGKQNPRPLPFATGGLNIRSGDSRGAVAPVTGGRGHLVMAHRRPYETAANPPGAAIGV
jgi:hypothetical protein